MTDALITSGVNFTAGTEILITYNGVPLGVAEILGETSEIYLSELLVLAGIPEGNTRTTIVGHAGRGDEWFFNIFEEIETTLSIQSVVSDDDFTSTTVIAVDEIEIDVIPPEPL